MMFSFVTSFTNLAQINLRRASMIIVPNTYLKVKQILDSEDEKAVMKKA